MGYKFLIAFNVVLLAWAAFVTLNHFLPQQGKVYSGSNWHAKRYGNTYFLSITNHSELVNAIADFASQRNVNAAEITGIGAVNSAVLRFFNPATKQYQDKKFDGQMEISNLTGNIATKDDERIIHLHISLGQSDYKALAGHLLSAQLSGAGEFVVKVIPKGSLIKSFDDNSGLNLYRFKE